MKASIEVNLKDFSVPNFVVEETKGDGGRQFAISDLDANTLAAMCEEFTRQVFEKAGKKRPPTCA